MSIYETLSLQPHSTISALQLRQQLGEVLERVYYQFHQVQILRKDKPMARLVSEPFMQVIDQLIEDDPALADTLALKLNQEWQTGIINSSEDFKTGHVRPVQTSV